MYHTRSEEFIMPKNTTQWGSKWMARDIVFLCQSNLCLQTPYENEHLSQAYNIHHIDLTTHKHYNCSNKWKAPVKIRPHVSTYGWLDFHYWRSPVLRVSLPFKIIKCNIKIQTSQSRDFLLIWQRSPAFFGTCLHLKVVHCSRFQTGYFLCQFGSFGFYRLHVLERSINICGVIDAVSSNVTI